MCIIIPTIIAHSLSLIAFLFLIWLTIIGIRYENKQCLSLKIEKSISKKINLSLTSKIIDQRLKLNHFTILGTHNSYHKDNGIYKYEHQSIGQQLSFGIRQFELDIHIMPDNLLVYHIQLFDDKTSCYCFKDCLMKIAKWTDKYYSHYPIYLFIEIKQLFYEDLITGLTGGVKCEHLTQIKEEILDIFSLDTFLLPKDVQGNQTSIKLALKKQHMAELAGDYTYKNYGWPPLYQSLGKILPVFLDDVHEKARQLYSTCDSLRNFFFIAQKSPDLPYSSIVTISNDKNLEELVDITNNGQLIRLILKYGGKNLERIYQATKPYGIHIVSSDSEQCNHTALCRAIANDFQNSTILCRNYSTPSFCNLPLPFV